MKTVAVPWADKHSRFTLMFEAFAIRVLQACSNVKKFFQQWYGWACRSRLPPIIKVAKMLQRRLDNLLTYMRYPITNAAVEGFNSKIQSLKSAARGFRSFANYRLRILFYCGKFDLLPPCTTH